MLDESLAAVIIKTDNRKSTNYYQDKDDFMKLKRIFAVIAVILLVGLYVSTLIFALLGSPEANYLFKASIFCTVIIPVILYGYILIYKIFNHREHKDDGPSSEDEGADT